MNPTEWLPGNLELRSFFRYFQQRTDCVGVEWDVANATVVAPGDPLGRIVFASGPDHVIASPAHAVFMRGNDGVDPVRLASRPSVLLALFKPVPHGLPFDPAFDADHVDAQHEAGPAAAWDAVAERVFDDG